MDIAHVCSSVYVLNIGSLCFVVYKYLCFTSWCCQKYPKDAVMAIRFVPSSNTAEANISTGDDDDLMISHDDVAS